MMVAGHLQIKNEKYYMVLELRNEQGERKTKWIGTGLTAKGNKRRAEAMLEETRTKYLSPVVNNKSQMPFAEYMGYWLEIDEALLSSFVSCVFDSHSGFSLL